MIITPRIVMYGMTSGILLSLVIYGRSHIIDVTSVQYNFFAGNNTSKTISDIPPPKESNIPSIIPEDKIKKEEVVHFNFDKYLVPVLTQFKTIQELGKVSANYAGKYYLKGIDCDRNGCSKYNIYNLELGTSLGSLQFINDNDRDMKSYKLYYQKNSMLLVVQAFDSILCTEQQFEIKNGNFVKIDNTFNTNCGS